MEELRSTETLDREILEDARIKAHKILKTADDTLGGQTRDWDEKIRVALASIRKSYEERTKKIEEEIFARFPLDKRRLRSETSESFLLKAMDDFLHSLTRETLFSILEQELAERLETWEVKRDGALLGAEVCYSGLSLSEARGILKRIPVSGDWEIKEDNSLSADSELSEINEFPSIVINTKTMKISASIKSAATALLKGKRAELAAALLGEGVLND